MHQLYYVSTFFNAVPHTSNASSPCRCHGQHPYSSYGLTTARWTCSLTFSWRSINNRNQKEIQAKRQGVNNCQQYPCKSSLTSFLWFFQNKMQCFLTLFCYTRRPSQLRNTVLTPRGDNSYASKQFASRGAVDWKTVRTSWKFYLHPCKIEQFVFPIIPVIQSPQFRSLDRKQNGKIPSICDVWRTP